MNFDDRLRASRLRRRSESPRPPGRGRAERASGQPARALLALWRCAMQRMASRARAAPRIRTAARDAARRRACAATARRPAAKPFSMTSFAILRSTQHRRARIAASRAPRKRLRLERRPRSGCPEGNSGYLLVGGLARQRHLQVSADKRSPSFMEQAGSSGTDVSNTARRRARPLARSC